MKTFSISAPFLATLALLSASTFAAGQQLQRSMVYHAAPQQSAPQNSTVKQSSVVKQAQTNSPAPVNRQAATNKETRMPVNVKASYVAPKNAAPRAVSSRIAAPVKPSTTANKLTTAKTEARTSSPVKTTAVRTMENKRTPAFGKAFDKWFYVSSAVFATGAILDHTSTSAGMKKVGAREANPLLRNSDGGFSPGKHLALTAGIYGASFMLQKKHPRMANVLRLVGGFAKIGVSLHNRRAASGRPDALPR